MDVCSELVTGLVLIGPSTINDALSHCASMIGRSPISRILFGIHHNFASAALANLATFALGRLSLHFDNILDESRATQPVGSPMLSWSIPAALKRTSVPLT